MEIGSVSGTVAEIGLVYTKITTGDNREIYIPNSDVSTSKIINYTSCETRRVDLKLSASYDASPAEVRAALLDAAASCPYVLHEPAAVVRVSEYGESAISYTLQAWTQTAHYWDVYYTVFERIKAAFDERGIEMTYPHLNVHILQ